MIRNPLNCHVSDLKCKYQDAIVLKISFSDHSLGIGCDHLELSKDQLASMYVGVIPRIETGPIYVIFTLSQVDIFM